MSTPDAALLAAVRGALAEVGDSERAAAQQAYMKSVQPYRGLSAPELRALLRPILAEHRTDDRGTWEATARELWDGATHREEWYATLALLRHRHYRTWIDPDLLPLCRHLVLTGAWWDVVDEIASHLVGGVLAGDRATVKPVMRDWSVEDDLWIRRTAILSQLRHRDETDTTLLADVLDQNLQDSAYGNQFFIRKAVGWALREYARTNPTFVRTYVVDRDDRLSGLSRREAMKHL